jgi:transposase-like protein
VRGVIRIAGTNDAPRFPYAALAEEFLAYTAALPVEDVARIAGVRPATIHRWRRTGTRRLHGATVDRLRRYLERRHFDVNRDRRRHE